MFGRPFFPVFSVAAAITMFAGCVLLYAASMWTEPSQVQLSLIQTMDFTWKAGVGAIFVMLSSKHG